MQPKHLKARTSSTGVPSHSDLADKMSVSPEKPYDIAVVSLEPALHAVLLSIEPFRAANRLSKSPRFRFDFLSADGDPIQTTMDILIPPTARFDDGRIFDVVMLHSSYAFSADRKGPLFKWLWKQAAVGAQICGIDTAPLLLAEAGLLKGYSATSHWSTIASFRELHPATDVVEQLFVVDRDRATCAGQIACLDLSLYLLERLCGSALCEVVANEIVYPVSRPDSSPQRQIVNETAWSTNPTLMRAQRLMRETIEEPLSIEALAARCNVSKRELQHLFRKHLKASPKSYYLTFRLQHSRELLLYSMLSIRETGLASGFSSPATYFRAFKSKFNTSPMNYRRAFQKSSVKPDGRRLY
jgi:transcriptional regulator GlxA family with amidase domain